MSRVPSARRSRPRTILLRVPTADLADASDHRICITMFAYWLGLNARLQNQWPMPREFAERIRLATNGLESRTNDAGALPLARALSLTAQVQDGNGEKKAAKLWRQVINDGAYIEGLRRLAQAGLHIKHKAEEGRRKGGRSNTKDGTRKPRATMRALMKMGEIVFREMLRTQTKQPTIEEFRARLNESLESEYQAAVRGDRLATYPFKTADGKPRRCPASTKSDYLSELTKLPQGLRGTT